MESSQSNLELLGYPASTCSQKVRLCLNEKRVAFKDTKIDLFAREHLTSQYLKLNPNGVFGRHPLCYLS